MSATSGHLLIAQAVVGVLLQAPALAGGKVSLPLRRPVPPEWPQAIEVRIGATQGETSFAGRVGPTKWTSQLVLDFYQRGVPGGDVDEALDALIAAAHERIHLHNWPGSLRVSQLGLNPAIQWDWTIGDTPQVVASYQTSILHDTGGTDLSP